MTDNKIKVMIEGETLKKIRAYAFVLATLYPDRYTEPKVIRGKAGEEAVARYLRFAGYDCRVKYGFRPDGGVDLIAKNELELIKIQVKTLSRPETGFQFHFLREILVNDLLVCCAVVLETRTKIVIEIEGARRSQSIVRRFEGVRLFCRDLDDLRRLIRHRRDSPLPIRQRRDSPRLYLMCVAKARTSQAVLIRPNPDCRSL